MTTKVITFYWTREGARLLARQTVRLETPSAFNLEPENGSAWPTSASTLPAPCAAFLGLNSGSLGPLLAGHPLPLGRVQ
jgi:hypothetical protein